MSLCASAPPPDLCTTLAPVVRLETGSTASWVFSHHGGYVLKVNSTPTPSHSVSAPPEADGSLKPPEVQFYPNGAFEKPPASSFETFMNNEFAAAPAGSGYPPSVASATTAREIPIGENGGAPVFHDSSQPVFRGDARRPETIFQDGFQPRAPDSNRTLWDHTRINAHTNFVSTSSQESSAQKYANRFRAHGEGWVYTARPQSAGIDAKKTFGDKTAYIGEAEVAYHGGIPPRDIVSATMIPRRPEPNSPICSGETGEYPRVVVQNTGFNKP